MLDTTLRSRFLAALAASGAIVGASLSGCGGAVEGTSSSGGTSGSSGVSSGGTSGLSSSGTSGPMPSNPPSTVPEPICRDGKPATACYTRAQLEQQVRQPPRGGDVDDAGGPDADVSMYFDENGCLPAKMVANGCCNVAVSGPVKEAGRCCYVHCEGACCGRPFLVAGEARVAEIVRRSDWRSADTVALSSMASRAEPLTPAARARIGQAWARDAAMEHASIASFARFTLELLAVGAPHAIVLGAQEATRDEVEHARSCFSIASRYAGCELGPGTLDIGGASAATNLAEAVRAAIVGGCIGETLSSLLAEARFADAQDAEVRATLRRIADEEARHAELAWSFVGWAIATGGDELRSIAQSAFAAALAYPPQAWDPELRDVAAATLRAHGLLDEATARAITERTLRDVVRPCAAALVTPAPPRSTRSVVVAA